MNVMVHVGGEDKPVSLPENATVADALRAVNAPDESVTYLRGRAVATGNGEPLQNGDDLRVTPAAPKAG